MNTLSAQAHKELVDALRQHVFKLAEDIGERNIYHPQALHAAERYIKDTWQAMGYEVHTQAYEVNGVRSANLEIEIPALTRPMKFCWWGHIMIQSAGVPVPMTMAVAWPRYWNYRVCLSHHHPKEVSVLLLSLMKSRHSI